MFSAIKRAFRETGCYTWQWHWSSWWDIRIHYSTSQDVIDYGMPEYVGMYPTYQVNTFCFSCYQAQRYSDYQSRIAHGEY